MFYKEDIIAQVALHHLKWIIRCQKRYRILMKDQIRSNLMTLTQEIKVQDSNRIECQKRTPTAGIATEAQMKMKGTKHLGLMAKIMLKINRTMNNKMTKMRISQMNHNKIAKTMTKSRKKRLKTQYQKISCSQVHQMRSLTNLFGEKIINNRLTIEA